MRLVVYIAKKFDNTGVAFPFTEPARLIAPPYSRNFSVNVVFPASGCEMIAKVLLLLISLAISATVLPPCSCSLDLFYPVRLLIICKSDTHNPFSLPAHLAHKRSRFAICVQTTAILTSKLPAVKQAAGLFPFPVRSPLSSPGNTLYTS